MEEEGRERKETDFPCEIFGNILNLGGKLASNTSAKSTDEKQEQVNEMQI